MELSIAQIIKYEGDNSTFVWKHPSEDFNTSTQLIVHESQEAIFFMNGQALDLFGAGRYTLETENIPLIRKVANLPTGEQTPFHKIAKLKAGAAIFATSESEETEQSDLLEQSSMPVVQPTPQSEEKFDVILVRAGTTKMQVIKLVKDITNLDLKEVKAIVDGTPKAIKEKVSKGEAEEIKRKIEAVGATVEIR